VWPATNQPHPTELGLTVGEAEHPAAPTPFSTAGDSPWPPEPAGPKPVLFFYVKMKEKGENELETLWWVQM